MSIRFLSKADLLELNSSAVTAVRLGGVLWVFRVEGPGGAQYLLDFSRDPNATLLHWETKCMLVSEDVWNTLSCDRMPLYGATT